MATKKKSRKINWQENYASFILGAIIVVILGLLVANFITNRNKSIDNGAQTTADQQQQMADQNKADVVKPGEYKVANGDSLSKIAEKYYGDINMWPVLARVNNITNPNVIFADMTLNVPSKDDAVKMNEQMFATNYKVNSGDTLFKIAEEVYGDGSKWGLIAKANNIGRLPNGNPLIFEGSNLVIPR